MVHIVSDSSTLYSIKEGEKKKVTVCPLHVNIDGKSYREYEDITSTKLISMIQEKLVPTTSQPSIGEKLEKYEELSVDGEVLDITMADGLSGTYESALLAKNQSNDPEKIHVVNSKTLCGPHRMLVDTAVQMNEEGASIQEIIEMIEKSRETDHSFLIPLDFQFLLRGGRVRQLEAGLGGLLKLIPVMKKSSDGKSLEKFTVTRTFKKAIRSIIDELNKQGVNGDYTFYITHAFNDDMAFQAQKMLQDVFPKSKIIIYPLSPAFITQGGPGCLAIQAIKIIK